MRATLLVALVYVLVAVLCAAASTVFAQDPPPGWLSYATATCPKINGQDSYLTYFSGKWKVPQTPVNGGDAFYSPWIGTDPKPQYDPATGKTGGMDLLQPVSPWLGQGWVGYTEHFRWYDMSNHNSEQITIQPGHMMHGTITYLGDGQGYRIMQRDTVTGRSSSQVAPLWKPDERFSVLYVVFEKVANCDAYPPSGRIVFEDLQVHCTTTGTTGQKVEPQWTTAYVEDVCNFRAHVLNASTISMTWNPNGQNPTAKHFERNYMGGMKMPDQLKSARRN